MKNPCQELSVTTPLRFGKDWVYKAYMGTNNAYNDRLRAASLKRTDKINKLRQEGLTWAEIGKRMKISRQRAQQLGAKA